MRIIVRRKVLVMLLCLAFSVCITACGKEVVAEKDTERIDVVQEIEEVTETQEQQIEIEDESVILSEETEIEIEIEEETSEIAPISYEDYNVNNITGYSNYIDEYATGKEFRIVICDVNSPDTLCDNVHDQTTYRGIALGDSREQVLEKYGEPHSEVVYKNNRWNHDGLEAQYNINYSYIDERYPEVFFCLSFNMDQNDNVLSVYYEAILMKWYE